MKAKKYLVAILLAGLILVAAGCEPEGDLYRKFNIDKGEHYSTPRVVETLQTNRLTFQARFNASCRYQFEDTAHQGNKNKLMGFSDCNSLHHQNSARFTWQWFNNRLEIYAYCYVNGERIEKFVGVVNTEEENVYEILLRDNAYEFTINHQESVRIARNETCNTGVYYLLWPYFGGSLPAPHAMSVDIKIIY